MKRTRTRNLSRGSMLGVIPDQHQQLLFLIGLAHVLVHAEFERAIAVLDRKSVV